MRKITKEIRDAFMSQQKKSIGNTFTDGQNVWLHGNKIVRRDDNGKIFATLAGWNTPTTRERVNGITGLNFHQKNFVAMLGDSAIDPSEWFEVA
tara:strand:- start:1166 stop:1447 length:282 start_codon:yes stop_codon:yes gene_type:complete